MKLKIFIIIILCFLTSCSEVTKLIPTKDSDPTPGLTPRFFSPTFDPGSTHPTYGSGNLVVTDDLKEASLRFARMGQSAASTRLDEFGQLMNKIDVVSSLKEKENFLQTIEKLPSPAQIDDFLNEFNSKTPTLKTSLSTALLAETPAPMVQKFQSEKIARTDYENIHLLAAPKSVFTGLATRFDPSSRTAAEANVAKPEVAKLSNYTVEKFESRFIYVRSFQPSNSFQALLECSRVEVSFDRTDSSREDVLKISYSWPRIISYETTSEQLGLLPIASSQFVSELRTDLVLSTLASDTGTTREQAVFSAAPITYDTEISKSSDYFTLRLREHPFNGAGTGSSFSLFHEAQKLFLFRFGASVANERRVEHLWSSFQIPFSKFIFEAAEERSEYGLNRQTFSSEQLNFLKSPLGLDGQSKPPADKWSSLSPLIFFQSDNTNIAPAASPEVVKGGMHHMDPAILENNISDFFPGVTWRKTPAESGIFKPENYAEILSVCKKSMETE